VAVVAGWIFGINPLTMLSMLSGGGGPPPASQQGPAHAPPANDREAAFVSTVLADTEDTWTQLFQRNGGSYQAPHLVLFRNATGTACGCTCRTARSGTPTRCGASRRTRRSPATSWPA